MEVRLDNAKKQGVPIPPDWVTALRSLKAGEICRNFVGDLKLPAGVSIASCNFLGAPKVCTPYVQGLAVGRCLAFSHVGGRKNFVLVAHVEDHEWLCHGGSFLGDCAVPDPFSESNLVVKDVQKDLWDDTTAPRRIRIHAKVQQLINQIQERSLEFSELVAVATFRAEEIRAARVNAPIDVSKASAMYEKNPFKWQAAGWLSQIDVTIVFMWTCEGKAWHHRASMQLHH